MAEIVGNGNVAKLAVSNLAKTADKLSSVASFAVRSNCLELASINPTSVGMQIR
jgi:hypothetical protein